MAELSPTCGRHSAGCISCTTPATQLYCINTERSICQHSFHGGHTKASSIASNLSLLDKQSYPRPHSNDRF